MKKQRSFLDADRYRFDYKECSVKNNFAQIDTSQDAWYFGSWINPIDLKYVEYVEGDILRIQFDNPEELTEFIKGMNEWNKKHLSGKGIKIDTMLSDTLTKKFHKIGLSEFLH